METYNLNEALEIVATEFENGFILTFNNKGNEATNVNLGFDGEVFEHHCSDSSKPIIRKLMGILNQLPRPTIFCRTIVGHDNIAQLHKNISLGSDLGIGDKMPIAEWMKVSSLNSSLMTNPPEFQLALPTDTPIQFQTQILPKSSSRVYFYVLS